MHTELPDGQIAFTEDARQAAAVIQELLKSRKLMRLYPANNPLFVNALQAAHRKFEEFFAKQDELPVLIEKYSLAYRKSRIYHNESRDDNLALFFFKDGIRLLSFWRGLSIEELQDFIAILNTDFDASSYDDDVVTMLWERDFHHIKYLVDENYLNDWEVPSQAGASHEAIKAAHEEGLRQQQLPPAMLPEVSGDELHLIQQEIHEQDKTKADRMLKILFAQLRTAAKGTGVDEIMTFIKDTLFFCLSRGDFKNASLAMNLADSYTEAVGHTAHLNILCSAMNSRECIALIIPHLMHNGPLDEEAFLAYMNHLQPASIPHLMNVLGDVETIRGRRLLINVLSVIGQKDIRMISRGLQDTRWYVVRNAAVILGHIATPETVRHLVRALIHSDPRVRNEAAKALGQTGSTEAVQSLSVLLRDSDTHVRTSAAKALASVHSEEAKALLLRELTSTPFLLKSFNEKKEFFSAMALWNDRQVHDMLKKILRKRRLFKRARHAETRACAAGALGILQVKDAVPLLRKAQRSGNPVLKRHATESLNKLEGCVS